MQIQAGVVYETEFADGKHWWAPSADFGFSGFKTLQIKCLDGVRRAHRYDGPQPRRVGRIERDPEKYAVGMRVWCNDWCGAAESILTRHPRDTGVGQFIRSGRVVILDEPAQAKPRFEDVKVGQTWRYNGSKALVGVVSSVSADVNVVEMHDRKAAGVPHLSMYPREFERPWWSLVSDAPAEPPRLPRIERDPAKLRKGMVVRGLVSDTTGQLAERDEYAGRWVCNGAKPFCYDHDTRNGKTEIISEPPPEKGQDYQIATTNLVPAPIPDRGPVVWRGKPEPASGFYGTYTPNERDRVIADALAQAMTGSSWRRELPAEPPPVTPKIIDDAAIAGLMVGVNREYREDQRAEVRAILRGWERADLNVSQAALHRTSRIR